MPELRSSTRQACLRSKKLDDLQPGEPPAKPVPPAPQRAAKRAPTRAARGRKGAAGRGAPPAPNPRRKGVEIADLEVIQLVKTPLKLPRDWKLLLLLHPRTFPRRRYPRLVFRKWMVKVRRRLLGLKMNRQLHLSQRGFK